MWHEARKHEKDLRNRMVDGAKRAERRRKYYDSVRSDPDQFMQIHGRKCQIHLDSGIARAAEASNILRKWQVDPNILIDRFDARSHLEFVPTAPTTKPKMTQTEELEAIQCDFESYRILVLNEFQRYDEAEFLKQIAAKEFWTHKPSHNSTYKAEAEKKKKAQKNTVGYTYKDDSQTVPGRSSHQSDSEESEEDFDDQQEYDMNFDVNTLGGERGSELSNLAQAYGHLQDGFIELLKIDQKERIEQDQIREIDRTKHTLSGKHAKSDRAKLKRQRAAIVSKFNQNEAATNTLLSMLRSRSRDGKRRRNSSSSDSEEEVSNKVKFVTAYDDELLPSASSLKYNDFPLSFNSPSQSKEAQLLLNLKKQRSESPDFLTQDSSSKPVNKSPFDQSPDNKEVEAKNARSRSSSSSSSLSSSSVDSRDYKPLEIHSSMSEDEKDRIQILNRKRRIEYTKQLHKKKERRSSSSKSGSDGDAKKAEAAKRLRKRLDKKLNSRSNQIKNEENEKRYKDVIKQQEKDRVISEESRVIRERDRAKRQELDSLKLERELNRSARRSPSPKRQRRSRSRSNEHRKYSRRSNSRDRSSHRSYHRSHRSRSRDRSRDRNRNKRSRRSRS